MRNMMRLCAVLVAAALALAGCASIPDSGSVHEGEDISAADSGFSVNYIPSGPAAGATQEQILSGFIGASSSPKNNYQIAREFLAPSFTSAWKPDQSLIVDTGSGRLYTRMAKKIWQLAVNPVADIDASGAYTEVDASAPVTLQFSFVKTSDGWRISKAPNGTVLDQPTFGDVFSAHTLYFFSPNLGYLVPDLRWFASGQSTPTSIVKALLAGPSHWLGDGAVSSAFPEGTQLSADSVPVDNGRAEVDLNGEANQATPAALRLMKLQLERSLAAVTGITTVSISVEGNEMTVPDLSATSTPQSNPSVDSRPLVYKGHDFGFLTGKSVSHLPVSAKVAALAPRAVTVSADDKSAAVLAAAGVYAVSKTSAKLVDARSGLIAPSLDPYGFIWSVPTSQPGKVLAVKPDGTQYPVATSWPEAASIVSLAVSRDGTRLIALLRTGSQTRFAAAAIIRDDHNVPTKLGAPLALATSGGTPLAATWIDESTVASLSRSKLGDTNIVVQSLGGQSSPSAGPADGAMLSGVGSVPQYWVLTSKGSLQAGRGTGWQEAYSGVSVLATQLGTPG